MHPAGARLVDIVRDFLAAYQLTRDVLECYRNGELRFERVQALVGDDERSVLYRLKEHCHTLFRGGIGSKDAVMRSEALFDLAVGSLFHEAMKFREGFYQRVAYGPKVEALKNAVDDDADDMLREFGRILEAGRVRIEEALGETEVLLDQTRRQLRRLLVAHRDVGPLARYLIENPEAVAAVFEEGLDGLLTETYGEAAEGFAVAGRSCLESGFFSEARRALDEAIARGSDSAELRGLVAYAQAMQNYIEGRYGEMLADLERWLQGEPGPAARDQARLALAAVSRIDPLTGGEVSSARGEEPALAERLRELASLAPRPTEG